MHSDWRTEWNGLWNTHYSLASSIEPIGMKGLHLKQPLVATGGLGVIRCLSTYS